jgi:hypothetical protein
MDSIQPHLISLKASVLLECPNTHMSSQYLCGTSRQDTFLIIQKVFINDGHGEMECVNARIDCGPLNVVIAPTVRKRLGLADEPAYVITLGFNCHVRASNICKTAFRVKYVGHLSLVRESQVAVLPMPAYDMVLVLDWLHSNNPDVDWQHGVLFGSAKPKVNGSGGSGQGRPSGMPVNVPGSTAREEASSEVGSIIPDIQRLGAGSFDNLLASVRVLRRILLTVGVCTGLREATAEGITDGK